MKPTCLDHLISRVALLSLATLPLFAGCAQRELASDADQPVQPIVFPPDPAMQLRDWPPVTADFVYGDVQAGPSYFPYRYGGSERWAVLADPAYFLLNLITLPVDLVISPPWTQETTNGLNLPPTYTANPPSVTEEEGNALVERTLGPIVVEPVTPAPLPEDVPAMPPATRPGTQPTLPPGGADAVRGLSTRPAVPGAPETRPATRPSSARPTVAPATRPATRVPTPTPAARPTRQSATPPSTRPALPMPPAENEPLIPATRIFEENADNGPVRPRDDFNK